MFEWLFTTQPFAPRGERWSVELSTVWQVQNGITAFSYAVIGCYLIWMWTHSRRIMLVGRNMALWVGIVFLMCAWVRANEVLAFHWPAYHFFALVACVTAVMASATAIKLPSVVIFFIQAAERMQQQKQLESSDG